MQINNISGYLPGRIVFFLVYIQNIWTFSYHTLRLTDGFEVHYDYNFQFI